MMFRPEVQEFICRYVDLGEAFENVATYYVLLTWLYDAFNERHTCVCEPIASTT
jgi:hypothetical protein